MTQQIDYYASLNSPWTHLGAARLMEIADRCGATVRIYPFDVITVFPATGGLPLPKRSPQRQAYRLQELERWRRFLNIPIQLRPKFFPAKEAAAAHCVLAVRETIGDRPAIDLAHRVLKALWEEDADTANRETLGKLIGEVGLDVPAVIKHADDERWAALRSSETMAAVERGVFGAPTYVVGEDIFWGQDRLDFLERRLKTGD
jgi:carboxymethylenebutenolidase